MRHQVSWQNKRAKPEDAYQKYPEHAKDLGISKTINRRPIERKQPGLTETIASLINLDSGAQSRRREDIEDM